MPEGLLHVILGVGVKPSPSFSPSNPAASTSTTPPPTNTRQSSTTGIGRSGAQYGTRATSPLNIRTVLISLAQALRPRHSSAAPSTPSKPHAFKHENPRLAVHTPESDSAEDSPGRPANYWAQENNSANVMAWKRDIEFAGIDEPHSREEQERKELFYSDDVRSPASSAQPPAQLPAFRFPAVHDMPREPPWLANKGWKPESTSSDVSCGHGECIAAAELYKARGLEGQPIGGEGDKAPTYKTRRSSQEQKDDDFFSSGDAAAINWLEQIFPEIKVEEEATSTKPDVGINHKFQRVPQERQEAVFQLSAGDTAVKWSRRAAEGCQPLNNGAAKVSRHRPYRDSAVHGEHKGHSTITKIDCKPEHQKSYAASYDRSQEKAVNRLHAVVNNTFPASYTRTDSKTSESDVDWDNADAGWNADGMSSSVDDEPAFHSAGFIRQNVHQSSLAQEPLQDKPSRHVEDQASEIAGLKRRIEEQDATLRILLAEKNSKAKTNSVPFEFSGPKTLFRIETRLAEIQWSNIKFREAQEQLREDLANVRQLDPQIDMHARLALVEKQLSTLQTTNATNHKKCTRDGDLLTQGVTDLAEACTILRDMHHELKERVDILALAKTTSGEETQQKLVKKTPKEDTDRSLKRDIVFPKRSIPKPVVIDDTLKQDILELFFKIDSYNFDVPKSILRSPMWRVVKALGLEKEVGEAEY